MPCPVYTIQPGDTLEIIGQRFGFTAGERGRHKQPPGVWKHLLPARPGVQRPKPGPLEHGPPSEHKGPTASTYPPNPVLAAAQMEAALEVCVHGWTPGTFLQPGQLICLPGWVPACENVLLASRCPTCPGIKTCKFYSGMPGEQAAWRGLLRTAANWQRWLAQAVRNCRMWAAAALGCSRAPAPAQHPPGCSGARRLCRRHPREHRRSAQHSHGRAAGCQSAAAPRELPAHRL